MSKVFKLRDRFEWMKRQRVVKEAPFVPRFKRTRARSRKRERERDWSVVFLHLFKISLSRLKAAGCNLFALTFSFAKTLFFFFLFFTRHALFTLFRPPERGNFLFRGCSHPVQVPTFAQLRVEPRDIRLKNFTWEIPRGSARVEICCRRMFRARNYSRNENTGI